VRRAGADRFGPDGLEQFCRSQYVLTRNRISGVQTDDRSVSICLHNWFAKNVRFWFTICWEWWEK